jgi:hypothetical protein
MSPVFAKPLSDLVAVSQCFIKNMSITNPANCEVHSGIRFLNVKNVSPAEIHCQLVEIYGEGVVNEVNVHKWCHLFNGGRTDVHNEA